MTTPAGACKRCASMASAGTCGWKARAVRRHGATWRKRLGPPSRCRTARWFSTWEQPHEPGLVTASSFEARLGTDCPVAGLPGPARGSCAVARAQPVARAGRTSRQLARWPGVEPGAATPVGPGATDRTGRGRCAGQGLATAWAGGRRTSVARLVAKPACRRCTDTAMGAGAGWQGPALQPGDAAMSRKGMAWVVLVFVVSVLVELPA
ncbi:protein of unknown function, partial [Pseudomonas inefficax]